MNFIVYISGGVWYWAI